MSPITFILRLLRLIPQTHTEHHDPMPQPLPIKPFNTMTIKTETFTLPIYWAPYFINGDMTGYTQDELDEMGEWEVAHAPGPCIGIGDDVFITREGDDGYILAERAEFVFQVIVEHVSDGETIGYTY